MNKRQHHRVRLPRKVDLPLSLLCEELKVNHFFYGLEQLGFGDYPHQPFLGTIILTLMQLDAANDAVLSFYVSRLYYYTKRMSKTHNRKRTAQLALQFYRDLQRKQKRRRKARVKT